MRKNTVVTHEVAKEKKQHAVKHIVTTQQRHSSGRYVVTKFKKSLKMNLLFGPESSKGERRAA